MLETISLSRLKTVHPALSSRIVRMSALLEPQGFMFRVVQARRTWDEQAALFAIGRTTPGNPCTHAGAPIQVGKCALHPMGLTVTKARPGYGWHEFGMAVDLAPDDPKKPGYQPDWDVTHPSYVAMGKIGLQLGLAEGRLWPSFPDYPHYQLTGIFPTTPDDRVRKLYLDHGIEGVWAASGLEAA